MGNNCFGSRLVAVSHHHNTDTTLKPTSRETRRDNSKRNEEVMVKIVSEGEEAVKEQVSFESDAKASTTPKTMPPCGRILTPNLKIFTFAELKSATKNFGPGTMLGEGGFGRVFRGWVDEKTYAPSRAGVGMAVAVKKSNPNSYQGLEEWKAEVKFLGKFSHPNLVRLLGYCWEESQFLLVYEYMQKGSLENHLFRKGGESFSWETRIKIAIEAARGLDFLHRSEKSVIYRDFKASNILLDGAFHAKLSDFGLAKFGPIDGQSHITTEVMGTFGYAAPEYVTTGHLYVKSDVYGFGVVLLELLTGLPAVDPNRTSEMYNLMNWAKPFLSSKSKLKKIMDRRLEKYPIKGATKAGELILKCLESLPRNRPSMKDVLDDLMRISEMKAKSSETNFNVLDNNCGRGIEKHGGSPTHYNYNGKDIRCSAHTSIDRF